MKNKKGFTLVELLAVIVILAILIIIATRSVFKSVSKSKDKMREETKKELEKLAEAYYAEKGKTEISLKMLCVAGYIDSETTNPETLEKFGGDCENMSDITYLKVDDAGKATYNSNATGTDTGYTPGGSVSNEEEDDNTLNVNGEQSDQNDEINNNQMNNNTNNNDNENNNTSISETEERATAVSGGIYKLTDKKEKIYITFYDAKGKTVKVTVASDAIKKACNITINNESDVLSFNRDGFKKAAGAYNASKEGTTFTVDGNNLTQIILSKKGTWVERYCQLKVEY